MDVRVVCLLCAAVGCGGEVVVEGGEGAGVIASWLCTPTDGALALGESGDFVFRIIEDGDRAAILLRRQSDVGVAVALVDRHGEVIAVHEQPLISHAFLADAGLVALDDGFALVWSETAVGYGSEDEQLHLRLLDRDASPRAAPVSLDAPSHLGSAIARNGEVELIVERRHDIYSGSFDFVRFDPDAAAFSAPAPLGDYHFSDPSKELALASLVGWGARRVVSAWNVFQPGYVLRDLLDHGALGTPAVTPTGGPYASVAPNHQTGTLALLRWVSASEPLIADVGLHDASGHTIATTTFDLPADRGIGIFASRDGFILPSERVVRHNVGAIDEHAETTVSARRLHRDGTVGADHQVAYAPIVAHGYTYGAARGGLAVTWFEKGGLMYQVTCID